MPQHSRTYTWFSCSAKVNNLLQPTCQTSTAAGFEEPDAILESALADGWSHTANGKDVLCPLHSKESVEPPAPRPRKTRGVQIGDVTPETFG